MTVLFVWDKAMYFISINEMIIDRHFLLYQMQKMLFKKNNSINRFFVCKIIRIDWIWMIFRNYFVFFSKSEYIINNIVYVLKQIV